MNQTNLRAPSVGSIMYKLIEGPITNLGSGIRCPQLALSVGILHILGALSRSDIVRSLKVCTLEKVPRWKIIQWHHRGARKGA